MPLRCPFRTALAFALLCGSGLLSIRLTQAQLPPAPPGTPLPDNKLPSTAQLRARLEALEKKVAAGQAPADPQNLALLRLRLEQARLWLEQLQGEWAGYPMQAQQNIVSLLDRADIISRAAGDAVFPTTSQMHERAYIAPADNSPQPYWVFVPKGYTPRRRYPLIVFLHGYDPNISKIEPWIPG